MVLYSAPISLKAQERLPFIKVAPNNHNFILYGGLRDTRTGARAMHVLIEHFGGPRQQPANGYAEFLQSVKLADARKVRAGLWHKGRLLAGGAIHLQLTFRDAAGKMISIDGRHAPASPGWRQLEFDAAFPSTAQSVDFAVQVRGFGHASIDDLRLTAGSGPNLLDNAGFEQQWSGWAQGMAPHNVGLLWITDANFVPWGLNYDRTILTGKDLVLEEAPIEKIDRDFREARRIGANSVRIFLQLSRFMPEYMKMDESALTFLDQVIHRARKYNLRIDLTGLSHINAAAFPSWYNERSDEDLLAADRHFWAPTRGRGMGQTARTANRIRPNPRPLGFGATPYTTMCKDGFRAGVHRADLGEQRTMQANGSTGHVNVVIYARVSSKEQEREGFSIPAQLDLLRQYAQQQGMVVLQEFVDIESASVSGRTGFAQMLAFLKERPE